MCKDLRRIKLRRDFYLDMISRCDSESKKVSILIDKVLELENSNYVLQELLVEQSVKFKTLCASVPF